MIATVVTAFLASLYLAPVVAVLCDRPWAHPCKDSTP